MKIKDFKNFAELVRNTEVYQIHDYKGLTNLTVSTTELFAGKSTSGHSHNEADEIYIVLEGEGMIEINGDKSIFEKGDFFIIPRGAFHKVSNTNESDTLKFLCVFEKYGERK